MAEDYENKLSLEKGARALSETLRASFRAIAAIAILVVACFAVSVVIALAFQIVLLAFGAPSLLDESDSARRFVYRSALPAARWIAIVLRTGFVLCAIVQIGKIYRGIRELRALDAEARDDARPRRALNWSLRSTLRSFAKFATYALVCLSVNIALNLAYQICGSIFFRPKPDVTDPWFRLTYEKLLPAASWCAIVAGFVCVVLMLVRIDNICARFRDLRDIDPGARESDSASGVPDRPARDPSGAIRLALESSAKFAICATVCFGVETILKFVDRLARFAFRGARVGTETSRLYQLYVNWIQPAEYWVQIVATILLVVYMIVHIVKIFRAICDLQACAREVPIARVRVRLEKKRG